MLRSKGWYARRYVIFVAVLVLHVAIVALLAVISRAPPVEPVPVAVQLVVFPPEPKPKILAASPRPHSALGAMAMSITAPDLPAVGNSPTAPGSGGHGSGVDWNAEARRAVQAFEIRRSGAAHNDPNPGSLAEDTWWPRVHHHAGEQYKTDSGDWIVWINAECYQIANSVPSLLSAPGTVLPRTICPGKSAKPRGD
jgi:hypothetical protein